MDSQSPRIHGSEDRGYVIRSRTSGLGAHSGREGCRPHLLASVLPRVVSQAVLPDRSSAGTRRGNSQKHRPTLGPARVRLVNALTKARESSLPRLQSLAVTPEPTTADIPLLLHVLVVDDDPRVRNVLVGYLTEDGHTVETATNGQEGLDCFQRGMFDLVVTDCAMPQLFGDEMAAAIKREAPKTPIILITGFGELMRAAADQSNSADIVVSKPIRFSKFRETIASVLA
jgi:CheY-like chemotaxis protein